MATIDYIPYATGGGAVVMSQAAYVSAAPNGVNNGLADPTFANKAWRQSSMFAAALANIISTSLGGINVLDDGNLSALITNLTAAISVVGSGGVSLGFGQPALNLQLGVTVNSNQLTIAILGNNGSAPATNNPVTIAFRDTTLGTGDLVARVITAPLSFTIGSGSTMGVAANNQPFRLWVVAFDIGGGSVAVGAINCSIAGTIFPLAEDNLQNSQTGTSGGNSAGLYYASTGSIGSKPIRILGYLDFTGGLPTAGLWTSTPKVQLFGPGQKKPGDTVQTIFALANTLNITPTSAINQVEMDAAYTGNSGSGGGTGSISFKRGATTLDIGNIGVTAGSQVSAVASKQLLDNPYSAGALTYSMVAAGLNSATSPSIRLREIMA